MGKTAFAMNVIEGISANHMLPSAVFSLEMSKEQLVQRLLCSEGRVDAQKLRRGKLSPEEYQRLATAAGHLHTAPLWIDDSPGATVLEMRAKARRLKTETDLGMLIIDYMQLMSSSKRAENRVQRFLYDVCDPYLRLFRRFLPPLGPIDLSPMVAIFALLILRGVLVSLLERL